MAKKTKSAKRKAPSKSGKAFAFISYRRADSSAASRWLYVAIQRTFGPDSVFMDTETIRVSDQWPHVISHALRRATHLIAVIGPQWLRVTDDFGRRRIDRDDDGYGARFLTRSSRVKILCRFLWPARTT